jgi:hypothetical protein
LAQSGLWLTQPCNLLEEVYADGFLTAKTFASLRLFRPPHSALWDTGQRLQILLIHFLFGLNDGYLTDSGFQVAVRGSTEKK